MLFSQRSYTIGKVFFLQYRYIKKKAKKAISNIKLKAYDDLYNRLNMRKDKKTIYKLEKLKERKIKEMRL